MQNQTIKSMQYILFLVFFLSFFLVSTFIMQNIAQADEILQSTARILSTSPNARILSTVPRESLNNIQTQNNINPQIYTQEQFTSPQNGQNQQKYGQKQTDNASAGFYFNMYNPYGPSISTGAYAHGTSTQNTPMRRSQSQIIRVDQNNNPIDSNTHGARVPLHIQESSNNIDNIDNKDLNPAMNPAMNSTNSTMQSNERIKQTDILSERPHTEVLDSNISNNISNTVMKENLFMDSPIESGVESSLNMEKRGETVSIPFRFE